MYKPLLLAGLACVLLYTHSFCQTNLHWNSSFNPVWSNGNTNGNAANVGGSGINSNVAANVVGPGSFQPAGGNPSPTVTGSTLTVPGSTSNLELAVNYPNKNSYTEITINFSSTTPYASFIITDIDKNSATGNSYLDQVTISGSDGTNTFLPALTKYDALTNPNFLVISGNTARINTTNGQAGNTASTSTDQRGAVIVNFGSNAINSITIRFDNATGVVNNPGTQSIGIGDISFGAAPLPVLITSFNAAKNRNDIILNWKTAQEINSKSFEIERNHGNGWTSIASVKAAGNSDLPLEYNYTDVNPQGTSLLYRLRQTDIDGQYKYSGIVKVNLNNSTALSAYPNPFNTDLNLNIYSSQKQIITTSLHDADGRTVSSIITTVYAGTNNIQVPVLGKLPGGIYYLQVKDNEGNILGRTTVIKIK